MKEPVLVTSFGHTIRRPPRLFVRYCMRIHGVDRETASDRAWQIAQGYG